MNNNPKITVVTVVYNGQLVIEDTIKSVLSQDYPNLEYIVVDGCSKDNTFAIVEKYNTLISKSVSEPDEGVYDAMNKGIDLATGEWILFMNAGDHFFSTSTVSDFFSHHKADSKQYSVLYGDAEFRLQNIAYISQASNRVDSNEYMPFSHQAAFAKTSVAKNTKFDLTYKIAADTAFFLQLVVERHQMLHIPVTVCSYNALEGLSADNEVRRSREIVALQAKWNNVDPNSAYFKKYIRNAQIKQLIRKIVPNCLWIKLRERAVSKKHANITHLG